MDNILIPITKLKMNKNKWLNTLIQYENDMYIKDVNIHIYIYCIYICSLAHVYMF